MVASWAQTPTTQSSLILAHLNQAISWYHRIAALDIASGQPSDALYLRERAQLGDTGVAAGIPGGLGPGSVSRATEKD